MTSLYWKSPSDLNRFFASKLGCISLLYDEYYPPEFNRILFAIFAPKRQYFALKENATFLLMSTHNVTK